MPWSSILTLTFYVAILLPHSLHRPNENFHPKTLAPIGNISNTNTNISLNTISTPVLPTYKKHGTPLLAEQLDRDFQHASSSAAKSVCRKPHMPYVMKLAKLHKEKNVLKQVLSQHRTGIDLSSIIAHQV